MRDILIDKDDDLVFRNGDFATGESLTQEVALLLRLTQGELKDDPILGPNLFQFMQAGKSPAQDEIQRRVKIHLQRDGKDYNEIKKLIKPIMGI
ncbi:hypothetical protein LS482_16220 [Sinomicrobium kalidii]|uniref:hypothetical protein n=1 Tax=Sinomicrobium kalidii TaxID=2900738 RepID=UPI001E41C542|nr:hypothetical protein [Sinomicrobium kalidii]UGU15219.1 hypothetical protein LS482_16220 [Sinomicrobium kalidii]